MAQSLYKHQNLKSVFKPILKSGGLNTVYQTAGDYKRNVRAVEAVPWPTQITSIMADDILYGPHFQHSRTRDRLTLNALQLKCNEVAESLGIDPIKVQGLLPTSTESTNLGLARTGEKAERRMGISLYETPTAKETIRAKRRGQTLTPQRRESSDLMWTMLHETFHFFEKDFVEGKIVADNHRDQEYYMKRWTMPTAPSSDGYMLYMTSPREFDASNFAMKHMRRHRYPLTDRIREAEQTLRLAGTDESWNNYLDWVDYQAELKQRVARARQEQRAINAASNIYTLGMGL
ncbi:MAG: hypothetical protein FWE38_00650 [Firmicutes bacterium]|nr:hypothetical protein [Bacillota bacterium]